MTPEGSQRLAGGRCLARPPGQGGRNVSTPKGSQSTPLCDPFGVDHFIAREPVVFAGARPPANLCDPFGVDHFIAREPVVVPCTRPPANLCDPYRGRHFRRNTRSIIRNDTTVPSALAVKVNPVFTSGPWFARNVSRSMCSSGQRTFPQFHSSLPSATSTLHGPYAASSYVPA